MAPNGWFIFYVACAASQFGLNSDSHSDSVLALGHLLLRSLTRASSARMAEFAKATLLRVIASAQRCVIQTKLPYRYSRDPSGSQSDGPRQGQPSLIGSLTTDLLNGRIKSCVSSLNLLTHDLMPNNNTNCRLLLISCCSGCLKVAFVAERAKMAPKIASDREVIYYSRSYPTRIRIRPGHSVDLLLALKPILHALGVALSDSVVKSRMTSMRVRIFSARASGAFACRQKCHKTLYHSFREPLKQDAHQKLQFVIIIINSSTFQSCSWSSGVACT